jgi:hypothetical protein
MSEGLTLYYNTALPSFDGCGSKWGKMGREWGIIELAL